MKRTLPNEDYPLHRRAYNLLKTIEFRSKKKNLPVDLDVEWIINKFKGKCEVTGLSFEMNNIGKNYASRHQLTPSIDRIVPNKGYVKSNCRMVIWWFNVAKQTFSDRDLWHLCNLVVYSLDANGALRVKNKEETTAVTT